MNTHKHCHGLFQINKKNQHVYCECLQSRFFFVCVLDLCFATRKQQQRRRFTQTFRQFVIVINVDGGDGLGVRFTIFSTWSTVVCSFSFAYRCFYRNLQHHFYCSMFLCCSNAFQRWNFSFGYLDFELFFVYSISMFECVLCTTFFKETIITINNSPLNFVHTHTHIHKLYSFIH